MKKLIFVLNCLVILLNLYFLLRIDLDVKFLLGPQTNDLMFDFGLELLRDTEVLVISVVVLVVINTILIFRIIKKK